MQLLEKHFDTAFTAPDGIKKLRELILKLAMQGKLVPQDPNEQPASELLKKVEAEKEQLVKEGKIKAPKPLSAIKPDEVPYQLPNNWEWVRLNEVGVWKSGSTPSRQNSLYYGGEIPWVKSGEVKQGRIVSTEEQITQEALDNCSLHLNSVGSVLIAMYGANIGDVGILEIEAATNQAICACRPYSNIFNLYLNHLLISLKQSFIAQGAGAAQPNISREKIIAMVVPLPPLAEQFRIVAKIDELMARCDELEKLRNQREQKRLDVHKAARNSLLTAPEVDSFSSSWSFVTRNFSELYSVKENVAELREAILQLAVMGRLVPQDPNDQPASELLKEIVEDKKRLVKEGKMKAAKPLSPINPEEVPYQLPKGWEWVRLGELGDTNIGLTYSPSDVSESGTPVLRSNNIQNGKLDLSDLKRVNMSVKESVLVNDGDLLICARNGSRALVGKTALITELTEAMAFGAFMAIFRSPVNLYLLHFINSPLFRRVIDEVNTMTINQITQDNLRTTICPLPPLAEQHRIVAKIDKLMRLCDSLEMQIAATAKKQFSLLNAVMSQV